MSSKKTKQKKYFWLMIASFTIVVVSFILFFSLPIFAADLGGLEYGTPMVGGTIDARVIVFRILQIILGILGLIALGIIIYAGWIYMTSGGNTDKVDKAKAILRNAVIGLIIIIAAFAIVQYLITQLYKIFGILPGEKRPGIETVFGGGALGDGPIQSVYPAPNQKAVPRNTLIMITFKQAVNPCSIATDPDGDTVCAESEETAYLKDSLPIKIYPQDAGETAALAGNKVKVYTEDNLTFILDPVDLLGQPDQWIWYGTMITNAVRYPDGKGIFDSYYQTSYTWKYQISNLVDITPPQVTNNFPWSGEWARNVIIRINFSEAMNAVSVAGTTELDATDADSDSNRTELKVNASGEVNTFDRVLVYNQTDGQYLSGKWVVSNQYQTVEFFPEARCEGVETNSCGDPVYCLPGNKQIVVIVKPAPLDACDKTAGSSLKGATDAAANSLDGDKDNKAEGCRYDAANPARCYNPGDICTGGSNDYYEWIFNTNNTIDLTPPEISQIKHETATSAELLYPSSGSLDTRPSNISLTAPVRMTFDKMMLSAYLRPDSKYGDGRDYIYIMNPTNPVGYYITNSIGDGCNRDCLREGAKAAGFICGNGVINKLATGGGEDCDDSNTISGDGCSSDCLRESNAVCGNGIIERGEDCDDGNTISGDGCISDCLREGSATVCNNPLGDTNCCGNGIIEAGEECDDGEQCASGGTACTNNSACGTGGNCDTQNQDGCSKACTREGSSYTSSTAVCGNGKIEKLATGGGEDCDDFNINSGDGCSSICLHEGATCGNGAVDVVVATGLGEECEPALNPTGCAWNCLLLGNDNNGTGANQCGNSNIEADKGEECDDGQAGLNYQETKVFIDHDTFTSNTTYGTKIGSGVKDAFQNCFYPGAGPDCLDADSTRQTWDSGASSAVWPNCQLP